MLWLYAAFATKQSVAELKCLLGASTAQLANSTQARFHQDEILAASIELRQLEKDKNLTGNYIIQSEKLKAFITDIEAKKKRAEDIASQQALRVSNGECSK